MLIKGSKNIRVRQDGDNVYLAADTGAAIAFPPLSSETEAELVDMTTGSGVSPEEYTTWERQIGDIADKGLKLKMLTRSYYDSTEDKNYNYYIVLTFSNNGQLLKAEGESQEVAFETTLHEHPIV